MREREGVTERVRESRESVLLVLIDYGDDDDKYDNDDEDDK